jgi:DNA repair protein RadA/Sms
VTATLEGRRPILCEIQALAAATYFPVPKRAAIGYDGNRAQMILAVIERRAGIPMGNRDVYLNVAGGLRIVEPAADLAVAAAIVSSVRDVPVDPECVVVGEIGLSGELRPVSQIERRLAEAEKLGFGRAVIPSAGRVGGAARRLRIARFSNIRDALATLVPKRMAPDPEPDS